MDLRIRNLRAIAADASVNNFARSICGEVADYLSRPTRDDAVAVAVAETVEACVSLLKFMYSKVISFNEETEERADGARNVLVRATKAIRAIHQPDIAARAKQMAQDSARLDKFEALSKLDEAPYYFNEAWEYNRKMRYETLREAIDAVGKK
jgi:hypothetical protein